MKKLLNVIFAVVFVLSLGPLTVSAAPLYQTACSEDVVVQADDWLSKLADKFYGDVLAFPAIMEATNQQNEIDDSYANIVNANLIEPGWKLCVPSGDDAQALLGTQSAPVVQGDPAEVTSISQGNFNPNYAANALNELSDHFGWLQDGGIDSQEIVFVDQELVFPGLIGGSLQFAQQDTDAVAGAVLSDADLVYIANFRDKEPWILSMREGVDMSDLSGITCSGGGAGGRNEFNAKAMIERSGGDPEQIEWIPIGGGSDARVNAFVEGQIDCVQHFDRHRTMVADAGGVLVYDDLENVPQDGFVVTRSFAEANPRTVVNYLKALIQARDWFKNPSNEDEMFEIMRGRGYDIPDTFVEQYERALSIIGSDGHFDIEAMETLLADSVRTGSLESEIDWREFVDMSYLNQAYTELGLSDRTQDYGDGGGVVLGDPAEVTSISQGNFNPNYAANAMNELSDHFGWLQEGGIESQEIVFVDQELVFPGLLGGSLQFAQQDTDAVAGAHLNDAGLIYIANFRDKEPWILSMREGIDMSDLSGVTCSGGGAGGRNEFNARAMIERSGGDPEQIEWIPIGGGSDARVNAFVEGQIDCVQHFDRHRSMVADAGGVLVYDDLENVPQDGFVVTRDFAESNPRTVVAYLKALIQARDWFKDTANKDEMFEIMRGRGYDIPDTFVEQFDRALSIIGEDGHFDVDAMDALIADSVRTGSLDAEVDWREFVDMSYLNQAYTELGMSDRTQEY